MAKYNSIISSFIMMLCLGSVYAWSVFVDALRSEYGFTTAQTQLVFGVLIGVFAFTMILAGKLEKKYGPKIVAMLSALLFSAGYLIAGFSGGVFVFVLLGIGVLGGMGTGLGYLVSITNPAKWFPNRKGLVTGIAAAGFGLGAIILTWLTKPLSEFGYSVLEVFKIIGTSYGITILLFSFLIKNAALPPSEIKEYSGRILYERQFYKLFFGIFCGTFSGLLVVGNLKPLGALQGITNEYLLLGISVFSIANFSGRLFWGWLCDFIPGRICIFSALSLLGIFVLLLELVSLTTVSYILLSIAIGFGFGANFVLFARETAHLYGTNNMGYIYPFVFLGYGIAGIIGPFTGGYIFDVFNEYSFAVYIASTISFLGAFAFIFRTKNK